MDLQPGGTIRSLYTGHEWDPEELIRADAGVAQDRAHRVVALLAQPAVRDLIEVEARIEAQLPFNCEHVVPQSWFGKQEPMRGDLHHLFACESSCNSFRGNAPYAEFTDFPESMTAEPAVQVVRGDCGKSEANGFEPAQAKGAAARAFLYFPLRYPGLVSPGEMPPDRLGMVLGWHQADPVSLWERHRNAAIFERQGNRNPFIDRPELAAEFMPALSSIGV